MEAAGEIVRWLDRVLLFPAVLTARVRAWARERIRPVTFSSFSAGWLALLGIRMAIYVALALFMTWVAGASGWLRGAIVVLVVLGSFVVGQYFPLSRVLADRGEPAPRRWVMAVGGLMVLIGVAIATSTNRRLGVGDALIGSIGAFSGYAAVLLGLGLLSRAMRTIQGRARVVLATALAVASIAGVVVGAVAMSANGGSWAVVVLGVSLAVSPVPIGLWSEVVVARLASRGDTAVTRALWCGLAVAGVLSVLLVVVGDVRWTVLAWGLGILAVLLLLITIRGDSDIVVVLVALALSFAGSAARPAASGDDTIRQVRPGDEYLAAMGDSYMSGEGATAFDAGTNELGSNQCRRAPTAYTPLLVGDDRTGLVPDRLVFLACSGAVADNLWAIPQQPGDPIGGAAVLQPDGSYAPGQPQLDQLLAQIARTGRPPEFVLVSIGGNDSRFGEIARTCVLPGDCTELADRWLEAFDDDNPNRLAVRLDEAYDRIRHAVGPDVPIVAIPYPVPLKDLQPGENCSDSLLTDDEVRFLHGFTTTINATIADVARDRGDVHVADDVAGAFVGEGVQLCDAKDTKDLAVNWLALGPTDGLPDQIVNPTTWVHNSMHPNERGHRLIAAALSSWLQRSDLSATPVPAALTAPDLSEWSSDEPLCPSGRTECERAAEYEVSRWQIEQFGSALLGFESLVLLAIGLGMWFVICAQTAVVRRINDGPQPEVESEA